MAPQTITDCGYLDTGLQAFWHVLLPSLPPDSGTLISECHAKFSFIRKKYFGPLSNSPVLLLCSPGQALLPLFLVQKWLDLGNAAPIAHFPAHACARWLWMFLLQTQSTASAGPPRSGIGTSPQSSSGSRSPFLVCAAFSATLFPSHRLPTEVP